MVLRMISDLSAREGITMTSDEGASHGMPERADKSLIVRKTII